MSVINLADFVNDEDFSYISSPSDLSDKYHIKNIIGKGVSSTVRHCFDKSGTKEYAVKIIDLTSDPSIIDSIRSEINVLKQCAGHQHIIELHDVFQSPAFVFLVLEMCKGGELFEHLNRAVKLSEKQTKHIIRQLLTAVEYIHSKHIVHRDLKPENILLDENMNVKVSDFGFAVNVSHDSELHDLFGTPSYMAPEVYLQSMYDDVPGYGRPVDIWAVGVIMYTLLAGLPPFWNRRQHLMIRMILEGNYCFRSPEWDEITNDAKDLISRMLVVNSSERLTAQQCLAHPFLKIEEINLKHIANMKFYPRRKFKAGAFVITAVCRMRYLRVQASVISLDQLTLNPYKVRPLRNLIDMGAFRIYGHWVKKAENQNRAALFENYLRQKVTEEEDDDL